jgi:hypothetical protein
MAQVDNLNGSQLKDWERRLRRLEAASPFNSTAVSDLPTTTQPANFYVDPDTGELFRCI